MKELFESLNKRRRPEDIAQLIREQLQGRLDRKQEALLERAARGSLKRQLFGYTSMLQDFAKPVGMQRQAAKAEQLFAALPLSPAQCDDPAAVEAFIRRVSPDIRKAFGDNDFKADRLPSEDRRAAGLDLSRRRYNKLFRHLTRMERKLHTLIRELKKLELTKIGKSALASRLTWEEFSSDPDAACFIAYFAARCNLRSEFTVDGQQRPYDEIADMPFSRCKGKPHTNWWSIAHVLPSQEVLSHLTDEQKGALLGEWFAILQDIAALLEETWTKSDINRETMVVRRGNDSSTWNNTASAWNKARDNWIALVQAMGMADMLDTLCFGKVLRLMAADVIAWHYRVGGKLDPNTAVWNDLPLPWEVLSGRSQCPRILVEEVCRENGVDPIKSGWTSAKSYSPVATFRPMPELVHGVTVTNPFLAILLRKAGYFSGKP